MSWLALVESNTTGSGRQFCATARERGLRPVVLAADPARYAYLDADRVDRRVVDTADPAAVTAACRGLTDRGLAGVTSSSEYFAGTAARVAAALGLPAPDPDAVERCRHKDHQRDVLAAAGVPVPGYRCVSDAAAAAEAAGGLGYPVVVKPTTGSGSVGVALCRDADEVRAHAGGLLAAGTDERGRPVPRLVLVERYAAGPEYSVETFDEAVVAVTGKHLGGEPYFVETGHDLPAPVPAALAAALGAVALRAVRALGLGWGPAHTELRATAAGPYVVEVNPRLAGGMIPTLVRLAIGVDLIDAVVARVTGAAARPAPASGQSAVDRPAHASIRFVIADRPGTVTAVAGAEQARRLPGVALAEVTVAPGTELARTHSFRDRVGYAVAVAGDPATAAARARRAAALLHVQIESPRSGHD